MPAHDTPPLVRCQIRPRRDADARQLHALFTCLADWSEREVVTGRGPLHWLDNLAVWSMQVGGEAVPIDCLLVDEPPGDWSGLVAHLRSVLPADLIDDVDVAGRSWNTRTVILS